MDGLVYVGVVVSLVSGAVLMMTRRPWPWRARQETPEGTLHPAETASATHSAEPVACPTCRREYAASTRFCVLDARALVPLEDLSRGLDAAAVGCRRCGRSFDGGTRFCPFDAEELAPFVAADESTRSATPALGLGGKICPACTGQYEGDQVFCGRDGTTLAPIN